MYKNLAAHLCLNFRSFFILLLFLALLPSSLPAQTSSTAALTGTVTDPTGAVIANATVTATNTGNGQVRTATTGSDGVYKIALLPPGTYSVKFEASGFETSQVPAVQLDVTETPVLNRTLTVGSQSQQVTVEAETEAIQTESSALGTVVAAQTVTDIPLSSRNYLNLISLSAGASASVNNADQPGKGATFLFVNGQNDEQNNFQMDGAMVDNWFSFGTANDNGFYAAIPIPNPDAIQEFKIQTSTYDAGYGRNPGANVNVVTKSGTNAFHGTGFEFFRNTILNANEWFYKRTELLNNETNKQPVLNQNQYGGTFGGPIKKDKLFFFVSYQETGQKNGLTAYGLQSPVLPPIPGSNSSSAYNRGTCTTPNWTSLSQCDAATSSFVTALATAISPNCPANASISADKTNGAVGGIQVACPTQPLTGGNGVSGPAGLYNMNPVAINILQLKLANGNYYIPGSTTGPYRPNTFSIPASYTEHQGLGNFDYVINSKNTLSSRYIYSTDPTSGAFGCGIMGTNTCIPGGPVTFQYWQNVGTLKLTSIVTNNFVNEAHVAYQRYSTVSSNGMPFTDSQVGITPLNPTLPQLSQIGITSEIQMGAESLFGLKLVVQQTEFGDQVSWTHGKHSIRAGGEFEHDYVTISIAGLGLGAPTFPSFPDFLIGRAGCAAFTGSGTCGTANPGNTNGSALNSNELGVGTAIVGYNGQFTSRLPVNTTSMFVQDDFKVNSRFTLNLGLRWEYFGQVQTLGGQWSNTWPSLLNTVPIPGTGCVSNGVSFGLGASGTGCSLAGFEVPSNFAGPVPPGVYKSNLPYITQQGPVLDNFAPRVGFAWQPFSSNRLAVRGGGGYFYDRPNGIPVTESGHSNPPYAFGAAQSTLETLSNPFVVPPTIPGPAGTPGWTPRWVTPVGLSSNLSGNQTLAQNFSNGLVYEWNVNTQYEFLPSWVLELGYVGSHGIRQTAGTAGGNGIVANTTLGGNSTPINTALLASPSNPLSCGYDGNPAHCITTTTTANLNLRVPYLGMTSAFAPVTNNAQTEYNSLQATVRKQMSHGLTLQAAYTWARAFINYYVGNPAATQPGIAPYLDLYGLNTAYRPQRLVFNYTWAIPLGRHEGITGQVLNGWTWSGVTTIQDGAPLLITDSTTGTIFANGGGPIGLATLAAGATNATVETSGSLTSRIISGLTSPGFAGAGYLNKAAFTTPVTIGNGKGYGSYGLGEILGPGQNDWDMTVSKDFKIKESQTLQFRTEFFNTFNHPQFSNPFANVGQASSFGTITSTSVNPRIMQFALKYSF